LARGIGVSVSCDVERVFHIGQIEEGETQPVGRPPSSETPTWPTSIASNDEEEVACNAQLTGKP